MLVYPDQSRTRRVGLAAAVLTLIVILGIIAVLLFPRGAAGEQPSVRRVALAAAGDADCPAVEAIFARGTGEAPGLGILGGPFTESLAAALPGSEVTATAVDYAANITQTSAGPGSEDMTQKLTATAQRCPETQFVIGGYSQGATVTDLALGIRVGLTDGTPIPADLIDRVAAVVVFGNPLGLTGGTIAEANAAVADRTLEFCNDGDIVCTGRGGLVAHLAYRTNGDTAEGARFAAEQIAGTVDAGAAEAAAREATEGGATAAQARLGATRMLERGRAGEGLLGRLLEARENRR
jgi:cutinase